MWKLWVHPPHGNNRLAPTVTQVPPSALLSPFYERNESRSSTAAPGRASKCVPFAVILVGETGPGRAEAFAQSPLAAYWQRGKTESRCPYSSESRDPLAVGHKASKHRPRKALGEGLLPTLPPHPPSMDLATGPGTPCTPTYF